MERRMKRLFLLASLMIFLFQGVGFAKNNETGKNNFETKKARALAKIAKKRSFLSELESCIASASSHEFMTSCRQKYKQELNTLHPKGGSIRGKRHRKQKN